MDLGKRIREIRYYKKMSQSEFVQGISSVPLLSKIENNQKKPSMNFLCKISQKMDLDVNIFFLDDKERNGKLIDHIFQRTLFANQLEEEDIIFLQLQKLDFQELENYLKIYTALMRYYVLNQNYEDAKKVYEESKKTIPNQLSSYESKYLFFYYLICSGFFTGLTNFQRAYKYLLMCEHLLSYVGEKDRATYYLNIALVTGYLVEDKTISHYYSERAHQIVKKTEDRAGIVDTLIVKGSNYIYLSQVDNAYKCLSKALREAKKFNFNQSEGLCYYYLGKINRLACNFKLAIDYYEKSLQIFKKIHASNHLIECYIELIKIYIANKEWSRVVNYFDQSFLLSRENNLTFFEAELHYIQASIHKERLNLVTYEKEMIRLINFCIENNQLKMKAKACRELGNHFHSKNSFKKSAHYFKMAVETI